MDADQILEQVPLEVATVFLMAVAETVRYLDRKIPGHNIPEIFDERLTWLRIQMAGAPGGEALEESLNHSRPLQQFLRHYLQHPAVPE